MKQKLRGDVAVGSLNVILGEDVSSRVSWA